MHHGNNHLNCRDQNQSVCLKMNEQTHVVTVKPNLIPIRQTNCRELKRSRELTIIQASTPNLKRNALTDHGMIDIVINVITNDGYEPIKSDNCKPSYLKIQNL